MCWRQGSSAHRRTVGAHRSGAEGIWQAARVAGPVPRNALGELIRQQRELAALPVRQFAAMAGISGAYLSQIERGLRAPSDTVLRSIAERLQTTAEALWEEAGFAVLDDDGDAGTGDGDGAPARFAAALDDDPVLTAGQRRALREIYAAFRDANRVRHRVDGRTSAAADAVQVAPFRWCRSGGAVQVVPFR
jgi:transcriptional regulator with XRE-family HTH domain